ncbi:MAG: hypothetical protein KJN62_02990 [Deltaproteobacteria bacterium]|nr:hypothetical protein [Deltaproteobacteria bacterium]
MASYPYNRTINIEEKAAAKEKNKRLFPDILSLSRLKEYFYPLAAKEKKYVNNQKFLQMFHVQGRFFQKESLAAGGKTKRRKKHAIFERCNPKLGD